MKDPRIVIILYALAGGIVGAIIGKILTLIVIRKREKRDKLTIQEALKRFDKDVASPKTVVVKKKIVTKKKVIKKKVIRKPLATKKKKRTNSII